MRKFYNKNEILFSILLIVIYVIGSSLAENISRSLGLEKGVTFVFHLAFSILLYIWLKKNDLFSKYGLVKTHIPAKNFLFYLPLVILASCNLWFGVKMNFSVGETILYAGSMLFTGFLEELIFRGFLFKAMAKDGIRSAIIVSSVTFGIGHIINLINGSGADLLSNLCQIFYAIAFGFLFVILFYRGKSLLPAILTHSVFNTLSVFAIGPNTDLVAVIISVVIAVIAVGYTLVLLKTLPKPQEESLTE